MGQSSVQCAIDGCLKFAKTRGWCSAHYERWRRNGDPGLAGDARCKSLKTCVIDGCNGMIKAHGWCIKHYERWKRNGDPLVIKRSYGIRRRVRHDGYVDIYEPTHPLARCDGYVSEHRKIAWDARLLTDPQLHIHHKNEVKTDNRLDNFEPKSAPQHALDHAEERGWVENQYGTWPVKPRDKRINAPRPVRDCDHCGLQIPLTRRRQAKYCCDECNLAAFKARNPDYRRRGRTVRLR